MSEIAAILFFTIAAGACIPLGGFVASFEHIHSRWMEQELRHFVIALGGGILLGAVSIVLVPEGIASMNGSMLAIPLVLGGGLTFFVVERVLGLRRHGAPQLMGMLLDYVPEAIALGGLIALGSPAAALLALLIGLQNLPEGFNAFRELHAMGQHSARRTLLIMWSLVTIGPVAGLGGYFLLADYPAVLGAMMLFASGGILYLIFQDIAPQSRLNRHWAPPLGAVVGFSVALFGDMVMRGS
ncbi:MAG: divalent cation transporter [Gammaproteobacteria bacterium]|jgi:ZIP family zinc transporter|nr:divalent cation transporter [Gammaproteobacteria bacterium]MBU1407710.1 divalent cation transporter [Gammaproteobacteria bacterium]MBU1531823.1 divalent cation transporter [Gammaproteobacteria bacterium]